MKKQETTPAPPVVANTARSKSQTRKVEPKKTREAEATPSVTTGSSGLAKLDNILKQSKDQISQEAARLQSQQKKRPKNLPTDASPKGHNSHQRSVHETSVMSSRSVEKAKAMAEEDKKTREEAKKNRQEKNSLLREQIQVSKDQQALALSRSKSRVTQEKQEKALQVKREKEALKEKKREQHLIEGENIKKQKLLVGL